MQKLAVTHLVVMVLAIIGGAYLANRIYAMEKEIAPYKMSLNKAPLAGFHKFASDIEWMFFINYLGSQNAIDSKNVGEVSKRLDRILSLDPNFEKAYEVGTMSISVEDPERAVEFLKRACKNTYLQNNWQLPLYAALIISYHKKGDEAARAGEAVPYYKMAIERARSSGVQPYMINSYVNACAKRDGGDKDVAKLNVLFEEWKKGQGTAGDEISMGGESLIDDLDARILKAMQEVKAKFKDNPAVDARTKEIQQKVFKDRHICEGCATPYQEGDHFCSHCGRQVEVFGICVKCGNALKGAFCWSCGTPAPVVKKVEKAVKAHKPPVGVK